MQTQSNFGRTIGSNGRESVMCTRRGDSVQSRLMAACAALVMLCTVPPARAELGGDTASIQADQIHMQGTRRMIAAESYTVHEIQAATGTVVREYVSANGKVFAVAWHGPWLPDLQQLLGSYFEQYAQAMQAQGDGRVRRRPVMIEQPGLVVQIGGHMRAFSGRAYVPEMLPSGVRVEDIK
jgi:hypothetical protein